jgi:DNA topoisomerase-1
MELKRSDVSSGRSIGIDPASGKPVSARIGRFGPFVQIGSKEDEDKPRFASLKVNQRIDTLTLEDALALFALPRRVGLLPSGEAVDANIGRFGPYVKVGSQFVSLKKTDDPYTVTMERVQELIIEKAAALEAATVKRFGDTGIRIVKNRFGFSIMDDKRKVPLPKGKDPQTLSAFDCEAYLAEAEPVAKKAKGKATVKTASKGVAKAKAVKAESPLLPVSTEVKAKRGRPSSKK